MTNIDVTIEILEIVILVPIFFAFITILYQYATLELKADKVTSCLYSVGVSAMSMVGLKLLIVIVGLLPFAILGTIFFLIPIASLIARLLQNRTKKYKNRWKRYAAKDSWKCRLKKSLLKTLKSILDFFAL